MARNYSGFTKIEEMKGEKKVVPEPNIDMFGISKNKNAFLYETQDKMTRLSTANLLSELTNIHLCKI